MSGVIIAGDVSGTVTLQAPSAAGSTVINLPAISGTVALTSGSSAFTDLTVTNGASIQGLTVGRGAGAVSTNTVLGSGAGAANTTGSGEVFIGYQAGANNTTGTNNTAIGGYQTLVTNTTGSFNTAIGQQALQANTTASNNTAVGYQAGYSNATGTCNNFFGYQAGYSSTGSGFQGNTFMGHVAGNSVTTGTANSFFGTNSGQIMTTGSKNTIIGAFTGNQGGLDIRTASNYIVLSDGDGNPRGVFDSSGYFLVGKTSTGDFVTGIEMQPAGAILSYRTSGVAAIFGRTDAGETVRFNRATTTVGSISVSTSTTAYNTSSDYRLKNSIEPMTGALNKVAALKPVTYKWNEDGSNGEGFIAHELAEVCPHAVTGGKDAVDEEGNPIYQGIDVSFLVGTLTAAIQELNAKVDAQAAEIAALKGQA
jgi:Chaperone of endosialidase